ncbi:Uncharacterized protein FWK35_00016262 [Aphis craccivora]|uniref:RNase H domain-containing protein n=1 Tax=Aphis craccivora TaxID=307492 RepID=A0A6G0ZPY0_APHCR|nr:Uncharacterized protein FWK35_00016262 [Aphis craccivora]
MYYYSTVSLTILIYPITLPSTEDTSFQSIHHLTVFKHIISFSCGMFSILKSLRRPGFSHIQRFVKKEPRTMCDTCKSPLTIEHSTINCPKFSASRHLLNNLASLEGALNQGKCGKTTVNIFQNNWFG